MEKEKQEKKETTQEPVFVKLSEMTPEIANKCKRFPARFTKVLRNGKEQVAITLNLHDKYLRQLNLRAGGPRDFISNELFNLILIENNFELVDKKGRDNFEWNYNVRVRFVKGSYTNFEGEYKSIEVIFNRNTHLTHFLTYDQIRLIDNLEAKKLLKINWEHRPDAISKDAELENIEF